MNLAGPLTVLATYAAAGTLLMLAAAAWWPRHHPAPQPPASRAGTSRSREVTAPSGAD
jgi:hypothetical protein